MPEEPVAPETANAEVAESAPATEQAETPESAPAEVETPEQTEEGGSEPGEDSKVVQELKAQRKKRQEAEQQAAYWKEQAEKAKPEQAQPVQASSPDPDQEPKIEDYENYDEYTDARTRYIIRQDEIQRAEKKRQAEILENYQARRQKALKKMPDYDEVISSAQVSLPNPVIDAIKESEAGPEIAYYLAKNPQESAKLQSSNPWTVMREFAKLEMKFKNIEAPAAQPKKVSQAPEPVRPPSPGTSGPSKSLEELSTAEFISRRNSEAFIR